MSGNENNEIHAMLRNDIENMRVSMKEDFNIYRKEIHVLHDTFAEQIKELKVIIAPMIDSYGTALRIGKWTSKSLIFLSVVIGLLLSLLQLFKRR